LQLFAHKPCETVWNEITFTHFIFIQNLRSGYLYMLKIYELFLTNFNLYFQFNRWEQIHVDRGAWQPDCNVLICAKTESVKNIFSKKVRTLFVGGGIQGSWG